MFRGSSLAMLAAIAGMSPTTVQRGIARVKRDKKKRGEFKIPEGYQHQPWNKVDLGHQVWLVGGQQGEPFAYGPHFVVDVRSRLLRNSVGSTFQHFENDLVGPVPAAIPMDADGQPTAA